MQKTTHDECYPVLEDILRAFEAGRYTRLVNYRPGESVLFDSKPSPGYVPGIPGKAETGQDYVPQADGTRVHVYYLAGTKASDKAKAEADIAARSGFDRNELLGTLVSIKRADNGNILLQIVAGNRVTLKDGTVVVDKPTLRTLSVKRNPAEGGGILVALALDQMLGIPYHQLRDLAASERAHYGRTPNQVEEQATGIPNPSGGEGSQRAGYVRFSTAEDRTESKS
jgi:hypothetical protein